ncbi:PhoH family protein [candidate division WOR-3 bacterium]|nr:PhoH family protein [candidate division WOR-3 bacterium]
MKMNLSDDAKIYVLDTNVIMYDFRCIYSFEDNNVVIPITVLEEIDKFKKGNEIINYNVREFSRELDSLLGDSLTTEGVKLDSGGYVSVETNMKKDKFLSETLLDDSPDHRILSVAYNLSKKHGQGKVVLVTKDINLRIKAKGVGVRAEDYLTGKILDLDKLYTGKNLIEDVPDETIDALYERKTLSLSETGFGISPLPNEYFILRNDHKSILGVYNFSSKSFRLVERKSAYGIQPRNAEQTFSLDALTNQDIQLATLSGKAGTGKTLMALAAALEVRKYYSQILLARPIIPLSNKEIGFLPGDVKSKIDPYMQPLWDNLSVIQNQYSSDSKEYSKITELLNNEKLLIIPLAFIRGRSLSRFYFIIDEAQNLTPHEVKTIITRAGEGTKVVFTGDPHQIDTPYLDSRSNGLTYLIDKMKGQEIYANVTLEKGVRSPLAELASNLL